MSDYTDAVPQPEPEAVTTTVPYEEMPLAHKVDAFVDYVFGGRHRVHKLTELNTHWVIVPHGSLATFDDDRLTRIVMASHRLCLRAEIDNHGMRGVKILLHNRRGRTGPLHYRHPTIEDVVAKAEEYWQ
jgi:hypothetical protein